MAPREATRRRLYSWCYQLPANPRLQYLCTWSTYGRSCGRGCVQDQERPPRRAKNRLDHVARGTCGVHQWGALLFEEGGIFFKEYERYINPYFTNNNDSGLTLGREDYGGISASRLETLEERLKDDVIAESNAFGGRFVALRVHIYTFTERIIRVLLHTEAADGTVIPVWEEVQPENVAVLKDIMDSRNLTDDSIILQYNRIPITAEKPPDFADLSELIEVVLRTSMNTPIVVNCQLGGGRSTLASILLVLIRQWLETHLITTPTGVNGRQPQRTRSISHYDVAVHAKQKPRKSYQVINSTCSYH